MINLHFCLTLSSNQLIHLSLPSSGMGIHSENNQVPNPWPDMCTVDGDRNGLMGAETLMMAIQWGAPSDQLTLEAKKVLDVYFNRVDRCRKGTD